MQRKKTLRRTTQIARARAGGYDGILADLVNLLESARRASVRTVNAIMTATYWQIGRRIVEHEQGGVGTAEYGDVLIVRLAEDLTARFGRGFGKSSLYQMRAFFLAYADILHTPSGELAESNRQSIFQTPSGKSATPSRISKVPQIDLPISQTPSGFSAARTILQTPSAESGGAEIVQAPSEQFTLAALAQRFPLPWSAYVRLLSVSNSHARSFYEAEALRGGWSVRQLDRQIGSQFYERTALSRDKAAMLRKGQRRQPEDAVTPDEAIKDPFVLEFLGLRDEYSETELEDALIHHLETFLLELGGDFAFVARQRRLRIGREWYRVDLLFFHRRLRCLVIIDLKLGCFTHADAGQMNLYLNYARKHWTHADENPPVGLILCAEKDEALARYALDNLPNKVVAAEYRTTLPAENLLAAEVARTRSALESRAAARPTPSRPAAKRKPPARSKRGTRK